MADRMDALIVAAVRQGFGVRQTPKGHWVFRKGLTTLVFKTTPRNGREWMYLINTLRGAGLQFPED